MKINVNKWLLAFCRISQLVSPMQFNGAVIGRVPNFKLLGVIITEDLTWNEHYDYIHKKALKRLYALHALKRSGVNCEDLVLVYCSLVRSVIEYASPVWAALPTYLEDLFESIQRKALRIIFGKLEYASAMPMAGLDLHTARRAAACEKFIQKARQCPPLMNVIPSPMYQECQYPLRSRTPRIVLEKTKRFNDLPTQQFSHYSNWVK